MNELWIKTLVMLRAWLESWLAVYDVPSKTTEPPYKAPRKKSDTTKFTQAHYDFIIAAHCEWCRYNHGRPRADRHTAQHLADRLNDTFGLDKSVSTYSKVWNQTVDRTDLATGEQLDFFKGNT